MLELKIHKANLFLCIHANAVEYFLSDTILWIHNFFEWFIGKRTRLVACTPQWMKFMTDYLLDFKDFETKMLERGDENMRIRHLLMGIHIAFLYELWYRWYLEKFKSLNGSSKYILKEKLQHKTFLTWHSKRLTSRRLICFLPAKSELPGKILATVGLLSTVNHVTATLRPRLLLLNSTKMLTLVWFPASIMYLCV